MASRLVSRLQVIARTLRHSASTLGRRHPPVNPRRILVAHHLLLGDTLMLTPLLAKLRERYPQAEIVMTVRPAFLPLFASRPYGVTALAYDPRDVSTLANLHGNYDLAIVPGDNRYAWLARASGARWIVAFEGDRPAYKSWPVDERIPFPRQAMTVADMMTCLVEGPSPAPYRPSDWPAPPHAPFDRPSQAYAVLHVGAGSPLRHWQDEKWRSIASTLHARGMTPVFSGSAADQAQIANIDPEGQFPNYAGRTDLPQLWDLLRHARLLVCPDTGIAHLGRIVGVPTVALFGQGSPILFGAGAFWRDSPFVPVTLEDFPCRDQHILFKREAAWIRRCNRTPRECPEARCMTGIDSDSVIAAIDRLQGSGIPAPA